MRRTDIRGLLCFCSVYTSLQVSTSIFTSTMMVVNRWATMLLYLISLLNMPDSATAASELFSYVMGCCGKA